METVDGNLLTRPISIEDRAWTWMSPVPTTTPGRLPRPGPSLGPPTSSSSSPSAQKQHVRGGHYAVQAVKFPQHSPFIIGWNSNSNLSISHPECLYVFVSHLCRHHGHSPPQGRPGRPVEGSHQSWWMSYWRCEHGVLGLAGSSKHPS